MTIFLPRLQVLCLLLLGGLSVGALAGSSGGASALTSAPAAAAVPPDLPPARSHAVASAAATDTSPKAVRSAGDARSAGEATDSIEEQSSWESVFARGLRLSKLAVEASETEAGSWSYDREGSMAAVPRRLLQAELLLRQGAAEATPEKKRTEKRAEEALRLYNHAKWLAERNLARAAEWRYREASRIAKEAKRSVLAAHSLSRLGYFLMHWRRFDEAREVLLMSEKLNTKANPLAPFLYGLLERQTAGADVQRLLAAEERILQSKKQPSEELEVQREAVVSDINYWRAAEVSPWRCLDTGNMAHILICLSSHAARALQQTFVD